MDRWNGASIFNDIYAPRAPRCLTDLKAPLIQEPSNIGSWEKKSERRKEKEHEEGSRLRSVLFSSSYFTLSLFLSRSHTHIHTQTNTLQADAESRNRRSYQSSIISEQKAKGPAELRVCDRYDRPLLPKQQPPVSSALIFQRLILMTSRHLSSARHCPAGLHSDSELPVCVFQQVMEWKVFFLAQNTLVDLFTQR